MAYEAYALVLSAASSIILAAGLYHAFRLAEATRKISVVWVIGLLAFTSLLIYQVAEVVEYSIEVLPEKGVSLDAIEGSVLQLTDVELSVLAEETSHTMPPVSAAIMLCLAIVIRKSLIVPL